MYENYGLSGSKNLYLLVSEMIQARTLNLYKIKDYVGGLLKNKLVKPMSHYTRLIRFMTEFSQYAGYSEDVLKLSHTFRRKGSKLLVMDGTKWEVGTQVFHFLTIAEIQTDVAVRLVYEELGKMGYSSQDERIDLMEKLKKYYDLRGMTLLGDREYMGQR